MLFKNQPVFCMNCGKSFEDRIERGYWSWCSKGCLKELHWKNTLYILGKTYYPRPPGKYDLNAELPNGFIAGEAVLKIKLGQERPEVGSQIRLQFGDLQDIFRVEKEIAFVRARRTGYAEDSDELWSYYIRFVSRYVSPESQ